jgi:excinuclease ABC subunit C
MAIDAAPSAAESRLTRLTEQRRGLPDQPGVYLFRDARGRVIYVGKAKSIRKRVASHFSNPALYGTRAMVDEVEHIESLAVATEAEALLTEQTFIKQYKPRFNIRLRDDKSYPYIALSLDEDFPRVYFTRERHRRDRAYFGPYSSAKRVRGTLDLLGKIFQFRSCDGRRARPPLGLPCLTTTSSAAGRPAWATSQGGVPEGIDGVIAFLSGRFKQIERDLEKRMYFRGEQDYEQATIERNRCRPSGAARAPAGGHRGARHLRRRGGRRRRDRGPTRRSSRSRRRPRGRQSVLPRQRGRASRRARAEEFLPPVLRQRDGHPLADRRQQDLARASPSRRPGAACSRAPWRRGGDPSRRARREVRILELAERNRAPRASSSGEAARRAQAPAARRRPRGAPGRPRASTPCRCAWSASTSRTMGRHPHHRGRGRLRGRRAKKSDYRRFNVRDVEPGDDYGA